MAEKIGRAVLEISVDDKQYKFALNEIQKETKKTSDHIRGISQTMNFGVIKEFAEIAVKAVGMVIEGLGYLADRGAQVESMRGSFDSLAQSVGETGDAMLGTLRSATSGLIDDMTLMASTNKAVLLGLPVTSQSMGKLAQSAVVLGRAMGQDAAKSMDDLTTALGRSSPMILDNLGLSVKVGDANEAYAKTLGKSAEQLTEAEKKQAFYNAAMDAADAKVKQLGGVHLTLGDRINQAKVYMGNMLDEVARGVSSSPMLAAGFDAAKKALTDAFGSNQQQMVTTIVKVIGYIGIGLTYVAQAGAIMATVLLTTWYAIQTAIIAVETALVAVGFALTKLVAVIADVATKVPGLTSAVEGFAAGANDMAETMKGMTVSLAEQTAEAARNAAGNSDAQKAIDKFAGAVMTTRDAMWAMADTAAKTTEVIKKVPPPGGEDLPKRSQEAAAKIADTYRKLQHEVEMVGRVGVDARVRQLEFQKTEELARIKETKDLTIKEREEQTAAVIEKFNREKALTLAGSDEIRDRALALQQELALAQTTGIEQRLLEIEFARQKELAGLEWMKLNYAAQYEQMRLDTNAKFADMTAKAQGHGFTVQQLAEQAGFKTRAELEATATKAIETYERMKQSGLYTTDELKQAYEKAEEAKRTARGETQKFEMTSGEAWMAGSTQILGELGQKHKKAAIAGAILATYQAIAKALASAPWPANLFLAAGAGMAGWANVSKIRSSDPGYAEGTPNLDFAGFGRQSLKALHGQEAVIPRGKGHILAGEIADSMPGAGDSGLTEELRGLRGDFAGMPAAMVRAWRHAMALS